MPAQATAQAAATWNTASLDRSLWMYFQQAQREGLTNLGTYNPKSRLPGGGISDHARYPALAFDVGGSPQNLMNFFKEMINAPGVNYVIYRDMIWSRERGLHKYTSGGHETHVHVSGTGRTPPRDAARNTPPPNAVTGTPAGPVTGAIRHIPGVVQVEGVIGGAKSVVGAADNVWDALKWPFENWDRLLEVLGGFIILLVGLILLGRSMGLAGTGMKGRMGDLANRIEFGPTVTQATPEPQVRRVHEVTDAGERAAARRARPRAAAATPDYGEVPF